MRSCLHEALHVCLPLPEWILPCLLRWTSHFPSLSPLSARYALLNALLRKIRKTRKHLRSWIPLLPFRYLLKHFFQPRQPFSQLPLLLPSPQLPDVPSRGGHPLPLPCASLRSPPWSLLSEFRSEPQHNRYLRNQRFRHTFRSQPSHPLHPVRNRFHSHILHPGCHCRYLLPYEHEVRSPVP